MPDRPIPRDLDTPWRCAICRKHYPVMPMARACEEQHQEDA